MKKNHPLVITPVKKFIDREIVRNHPFVKDYIAHLRGLRYKPKTISRILYAIRMLFDWLYQYRECSAESIPLKDLTPMDIETVPGAPEPTRHCGFHRGLHPG